MLIIRLQIINNVNTTITTEINNVNNTITTINDNLTNEINSIQYDINNITPKVNKTRSYHTNHTDFMHQQFNTNHNYDTRRTFTKQNNYFTYKRRITHTDKYDFRIAVLEAAVNVLQTQVNNLLLGGIGGCGSGGGVINI